MCIYNHIYRDIYIPICSARKVDWPRMPWIRVLCQTLRWRRLPWLWDLFLRPTRPIPQRSLQMSGEPSTSSWANHAVLPVSAPLPLVPSLDLLMSSRLAIPRRRRRLWVGDSVQGDLVKHGDAQIHKHKDAYKHRHVYACLLKHKFKMYIKTHYTN